MPDNGWLWSGWRWRPGDYDRAAAEWAASERTAPLPPLAVAIPPDVPAVEHIRQALRLLGIPCEDESTRDTPKRFVRALTELTAGARVDPDRHFERTFPPPSDDPGMIIAQGVPFSSVCEHHLLPFTGSMTLAYIPEAGARIVGVSKLARVAQDYAARPQMQERLGDQVVAAIVGNLETVGAACLIRSVHSCMTLRGVRAAGAAMMTSHLAGQFRKDPAVRAEFLGLAVADT